MKDKNHVRSSFIGGPSVILILMVIGMIVFSLLALKSSINEKKLADKTAESVWQYYELEKKAEITIGEIDRILADTSVSDSSGRLDRINSIPSVSGAEYKDNEDIFLVTLSIDAKETEMGLKVALKINPRENSMDVLEWRLFREEAEEGYEFNLPD